MQSKKSTTAMDEEIEAILMNDNWQLATLPKGQKAIRVKWVYKENKNTKGEVERYKARFIAERYNGPVWHSFCF